MTRFLRIRTPRTPVVLALCLGLVATGCAEVAAVPGDARPEVPDASDLGTIELPVSDPGEDEVAAADAPPTCQALLKDWQCLDTAGCPPWETCTGSLTCDTPPCWGEYCQDFPGVCLVRTLPVPCQKPADCTTQGMSCAGVGVAGDPATWSACRALPALKDPCWNDLDCGENLRCAGATHCPPGRLAPCAEHPGRCSPPTAAGSCLTDDDCPAGQACQGATLCALDAATCQDQPGTCQVGGRAGCYGNLDCKSDPSGPICVGGMPGRAGYCSPAPAFHQGECWQDRDCASDTDPNACLGAAPCPPGDRCRAGTLHGGYCGPYPLPAAAGLEITFLPKAGPGGVDKAVIHNGLPVAIYIPSCFTLELQTRKGTAWDPDPYKVDLTGWMDDPLCDPDVEKIPPLRLPSGGSRVLTGLAGGSPSATAPNRLGLFYRMGCDFVDVQKDKCLIEDRFASSPEFP